jgi:putative ABC transport system permease protein
MLWTLSLLGGLGAAAGLVVVLGLLLYLQAKHRAAVISSALTRRMGLSRLKEFLSWAFEIAGASMISYTVAVAAALPVAELMHRRLDLRPSLVPSSVLIVPVATILLVGVTMILVSAVSAWRQTGFVFTTEFGEPCDPLELERSRDLGVPVRRAELVGDCNP